MPRLILIAAIALAIYILVRRANAQPPHKRRAAYMQLILGGAALAAVILTLMGKMHWIGAAATGLLVAFRQLLPVLIRSFPALSQWWQSRQQAGTGQQSEVKTRILKMTLDHSSGELQGLVLEGEFKDWYLSELNRSQCAELLEYCRSEDEDSAQLLASYLEQRFPEEDDIEESSQAPNSSSGMTEQEALAILGLKAEATEEEIVAAHRSLMQKMHPDRGGNDYLAAKINEAKDFLLNQR